MPKEGSLVDSINWRGISLLSAPDTFMVRIMLDRVNEALDGRMWRDKLVLQKEELVRNK